VIFHGAIPSDEVKKLSFDAIVAACGYESRARYLPGFFTNNIPSRIACRFQTQRVMAFEKNQEFFKNHGYRFVDASENQFGSVLHRHLVSGAAIGDVLRVFVDISSQSRSRLADIIEVLEKLSVSRSTEVVFGYALARFHAIKGAEVPNVDIGPVSSRFAGWTVDPERPLVLVIGLGYEEDRALGAFEYLEPSETWALTPRSSLPGYQKALRQANTLLVDSIRSKKVIEYDVEDPNATYAKLASLVLHTGGAGSVVILPGGPKILALLALLVALERSEIAVWRVSAGAYEPAIERKPSGKSVFIRYTFGSA
jgi:hypothetical protein